MSESPIVEVLEDHRELAWNHSRMMHHMDFLAIISAGQLAYLLIIKLVGL